MTIVPTSDHDVAPPPCWSVTAIALGGHASHPVAGELSTRATSDVGADRRDAADRDEGPVSPDQPPVRVGEDERANETKARFPRTNPIVQTHEVFDSVSAATNQR